MSYTLIPLDQIHVNREINARGSTGPLKGDNSIASLRASITSHGLLSPLTVRQVGPTEFYLVAGFRRIEAIKEIKGMDQVPCLILADGNNDRDDVIVNALENLQRRDLNSFDASEICCRLREVGLDTRASARAVGKKKDWVIKHLRHRDRLCDDALVAWSKGDVRLTGTVRDSLAQLDHDEQRDWLAGKTGETGETGKKRDLGERKLRPRTPQIAKSLDALAEADHLDDAYRAGMRDALRYVLGQTTEDDEDGKPVCVLVGVTDMRGVAAAMNRIGGGNSEKVAR